MAVMKAVIAALAGALAAGSAWAQAQCSDFATSDFKKVPLATGLESPLKMKIADDGRIFFIQRTGNVMLLKPGANAPTVALHIDVANNSNNEDGVLGIALDPKFNSNNFVYIYHTLNSSMGYWVSRYTAVGDILDPASEKIVIKLPHEFTKYGDLIIHAAGAIAFDPNGNLLIASGDSKITLGGFPVPVNENTDNFDAQKTSANSNNYHGKILRIHPEADGSYTIPDGNLFPKGTANTLPEIYAMGVRNPFTLTIDPKTGWAYSGEVGPDGVDPPIASQDEVNQIKVAGNFGWPYFTGDNQAYSDMSGKKYDVNNVVNNSKNNTGIKTLPAPQKALFWFSNTGSWPTNVASVKPNQGNRCIKVGGFYRFNPAGANPKRLPPAMDNGFFMANHNDNETLRFFKLDDNGALTAIKNVMTGLGRPISMEIGPDGSLYLMEWGGDNGHWFNQKNGILSRIDYTGACSTTTGLAARFLGDKPAESRLMPLSAGQEILFPQGAAHAELYDLKGAKRAVVPAQASGGHAHGYAPAGMQSGLMYVKFTAI